MALSLAPRTVIEALLPTEGGVVAAEVYRAANLAGLSDQPVRLALRRMISAGDLVQRGRGRAASLELTPRGAARLAVDRQSVSLAFAQDAGEAAWDGRWRLIALSTPEGRRDLRDMLRRRLTALGAVAISTSLYLTPHDLRAVLPEGTHPYVSTATTDDLDLHGQRDPRLIAETVWPSAPTIAAYGALADALRIDEETADVPAIVRHLRLADALERAMRDDPLLPPELRAPEWAPAAHRDEWVRRWRMIDDGAAGAFRGWISLPG